MTRCTTQFDEPFLRQMGPRSNRNAYLAAGYTVEADRACIAEQVETHARWWKRTRSSMAFNPKFQSTDGDGNLTSDDDFPVAMMDQMRAVLGEWAVLGNNSLSSSRIGDSTYGPLYDAMVSLGRPLYWQTATAAKIGDWRFVLDWAASQGANYVELPLGYTNWSLNELGAFDTRLEAN